MSICFSRFTAFLNLLRLEVFFLSFFFVMLVRKLPQDTMIQDKICRQKYNLSEKFCWDLPEFDNESHPDYHFKSEILGDATQYTMYTTIVATIPSVILLLFMGSWTDKYIHANKCLMFVGALSFAVESVIQLVLAVNFDSCK